MGGAKQCLDLKMCLKLLLMQRCVFLILFLVSTGITNLCMWLRLGFMVPPM